MPTDRHNPTKHMPIMTSPRYLLVLVIALFLNACGTAPKHKVIPLGDLDLDAIPDAVPRSEPLSQYGNPESYVEGGRRYWIIPNPKGYVERGLASWYGPNFHGKRSSSGEPYDMYKMTAAHKTLPLPTYVRVTNLENNRSVVVKVNDRGPFKDGRILDLSYVAAAKLGIIGNGTATVELHVLDEGVPSAAAPGTSDDSVVTSGIAAPAPLPVETLPAPADTAPTEVPPGAGSGLSAAEAQLPTPGEQPTTPSASETTTAASTTAQAADNAPPAEQHGVFIQVGAFSNLQNAERAKQKLLEVQQHPVTISPVQGRYQMLQRVQIGPFESKADAEKLESTLNELGFKGHRIISR